ncbi:hypothetical protein ACH5RR_025147 [Cinchona calisaya]|uniref:Disease resistance protein RPP13-like n=1 Tax=Cinchona calisaya TaxID=153742 RepID=A0ABD2Z253_9GENT
MADAVVSFAVKKLGDFLIQEIGLRKNVRTQVEWLRNELGYMQSFIKDAEEKHGSDHRVLQWILEITDVANDTVVILEDFSLKVGRNEFVDILQMCACGYGGEASLSNIGKGIKSLKERVLDISRKRETYGIRDLSDAGEGQRTDKNNKLMLVKTLRRSTSYIDEAELFVGFKDVTETLLAELFKEEPRRRVISIYGMGGLGKTTVARKLYSSSRTMIRFTHRAWVCVSQEYSTSDLLLTLIKSFTKGCKKEELELIEKMNEEDLERHLRKILKDHRYLVVVDDVWHKEAWESLKRAFPHNKNGSRVIITTRKKDVATRVDNNSLVHELRFLTANESWDLFCKKLSNGDGQLDWCSTAMLDLGREMVTKCSGLPLAIVVLGGLLCHKKGLQEWHRVKDHIWRHLKDDSLEISFLLSLSYSDLSSELKQCFLYLGIFPEDFLIDCEKLMWLWMAEDFIAPREERIEDVADHYLNELVNRSLIQVTRKLWDKISGCRIHDLLRDLAVQKAKEVNFFDIYDPRINSTPPSRRRQAVHSHIEKYFSRHISKSKLRSLVFFNVDLEGTTSKNFNYLCRNFIYLCVLNIEKVRFGSGPDGKQLPNFIGNLIHLKFLGISNTSFRRIPSSIGKLKSLQTFYASSPGSVLKLPPQICELTNLRHLVTRYQGHLNIVTLKNLQTLKWVDHVQWVEIDTTNLVNLRELVIQEIRAPQYRVYSLDSIGKLKCLSTLTLLCSSGAYFPPLEPLSFCQQLLRLGLNGKIQTPGDLEKLPQSITMLTLVSSELANDPMPMLESLPNLQDLELYSAYEGNAIACNAKGFPELRYLRLGYLTNLESWQLAYEAMPGIRGLVVFGCPKLIVPERLRHISDINKS